MIMMHFDVVSSITLMYMVMPMMANMVNLLCGVMVCFCGYRDRKRPVFMIRVAVISLVVYRISKSIEHENLDAFDDGELVVDVSIRPVVVLVVKRFSHTVLYHS